MRSTTAADPRLKKRSTNNKSSLQEVEHQHHHVGGKRRRRNIDQEAAATSSQELHVSLQGSRKWWREESAERSQGSLPGEMLGTGRGLQAGSVQRIPRRHTAF